MAPDARLAAPEELALYVHWPFCLAKCPYCDFNSHVAAGEIDRGAWRRALLAELDRRADELPGRTLASVFFGGGTPSLMPPAIAAAVLDRAAARWRLAGGVEVTLEANPTSAEARVLADMAAAGANRVSLGVQALDDAALRFLGRGHDSAEALAAVDAARRLFPRWSFDLIYARPGQTVPAWRRELARALAHAGDHLSVYQLTVEKGTPFHAARRRGAFALPGEDAQAGMFEATQEVLEAAGLPAYEISNHARPGGECRHNLAYWRYGDYAGVGPGAHGRLTLDGALWATETHPAPARWLAAVEARGDGERRRERLDAAARRSEALLMGLRLAGGIRRSDFARRVGAEIEDALDARRLAALEGAGLLERDGAGLRATAAGRLRLDSVAARLVG